ncbi:type IV pilus twitching motility protein PilT, partial [Elusimicrobiota bacterium]
MDIMELLQAAVKYGASDVHIVPERPPFLRINGEMRALSVEAMNAETTQRLIFGALSEKLIEKFKLEGELDTSLTAQGIGRFRMNVLEQKDGLGSVLRVIPTDIPDPDKIGLTDTLKNLTKIPRGMILVTGPTGSGKSTTLASMINMINVERKEHILTIEDP